MNALVGAAGLEPTLVALQAGHRLALANKESLVAGGELVLAAAAEGGGEIVPVDSEHSAILQCCEGYPRAAVQRVVLTASGGPFRGRNLDALRDVRPEEALQHPTWDMGAKITIDSATLANKALEVIEAHHLYGLGYDAIDAVIHPQSVIHSFVEFVDGSVLAQLGFPTMELPILYALSYPERVDDPALRTYDPVGASPLTFEDIDHAAFPLFGLGAEAGRRGGCAPAVYNAGNEIAVEEFLKGRIRFPEMADVVSEAMTRVGSEDIRDVDDVIAADQEARRVARAAVGNARRGTDGSGVMTVLATVVVLGVLIFVHELGHFAAAKAVGIEVQRFSIGLGPKLVGFRAGETEYVLSVIPLGGYVKMGGMDDEVMERLEGGAEDGAPREPSPRDFDQKSIWARTLVISAGVIMNVIFAFGVYTFVAARWGIPEYSTTRIGRVVEGDLPAGTEAVAGITPGSRVVRIGDEQVRNWGDIVTGLDQAAPGPADRAARRAARRTSRSTSRRIRRHVEPWRRRSTPGWRRASEASSPDHPPRRAGSRPGTASSTWRASPSQNWWDVVREIESRPGQQVDITISRGGKAARAKRRPSAPRAKTARARPSRSARSASTSPIPRRSTRVRLWAGPRSRRDTERPSPTWVRRWASSRTS